MIIKFFSFSKKYFFPILVLSLVFIWLAPNWRSKIVSDNENLRDIRSGYPLGYVSTDFLTGSIYESGPYKFESQYLDINFGLNGDRSTIIWTLLFLSIAIMQLMFTMAFFAFFLVFFSA